MYSSQIFENSVMFLKKKFILLSQRYKTKPRKKFMSWANQISISTFFHEVLDSLTGIRNISWIITEIKRDRDIREWKIEWPLVVNFWQICTNVWNIRETSYTHTHTQHLNATFFPRTRTQDAQFFDSQSEEARDESTSADTLVQFFQPQEIHKFW